MHRPSSKSVVASVFLWLACGGATTTCHGWIPPPLLPITPTPCSKRSTTTTTTTTTTTILRRYMSEENQQMTNNNNNINNNNNNYPPPPPTTFREAEILGLRLMQEQNHEAALQTFQAGLKLPGSRKDVIRTQSLKGASPVGGSTGGRESTHVATLDEFEYQAAHYNLACAHAQLGQIDDAVSNLRQCFDCGFDNYATVRGDPDLATLQETLEFQDLLDTYDPPGTGLFPNPFGFLGGGGT